jgi:hypothetical protein
VRDLLLCARVPKAALPVRTQEVIPPALKRHFTAVDVSATEAGKAVPEIAGGLRGVGARVCTHKSR